MIIINLKGGLGNQMFQYAFGRNLALKKKTSLKLDLTYLMDRTPRKYFQFRDYELDIFKIDAKIVNDDFIQKNNLPVLKEPHFHFFPKALSLPGDLYLDGYWQSEKYFIENENIIKEDFCFKNKLSEEVKIYAEQILNSNSVCLHVRHGFVNNRKDRLYHGFVGIKYINKAINLINSTIENPEYFIFSDNHDWCSDNIKTDFPIHHVEKEIELENKDYFQLMTLCKHYIISNSSFSWWGAWLCRNPGKIVIAPKRWFRFSMNNTKDLLPDNWIKI
ncbi:MAG: alpha-1,2-fucosyltransferase [bacterium]